MSIQVKLGQLVLEDKDQKIVVLEALKKLAESRVSLTVAFKLSEIIEVIAEKVQNFQKQRLELIKANGTELLDAEGKPSGYQALPEKIPYIEEELFKVCELQIELPWNKFDLTDFEGVTIDNSMLMSVIKWLFNKPCDSDTLQ